MFLECISFKIVIAKHFSFNSNVKIFNHQKESSIFNLKYESNRDEKGFMAS